MSAKTPHDVGPQADVAHEIEQAVRDAAQRQELPRIAANTLLQAIEYLRSLRGEGVAEGEARAQRALQHATDRMTAAIGVVGWLEAHDDTGRHRAVNRQLRDALGLPGRMTITCPCPEHTKGVESTCRRCGLSSRAAIAGVLCEPPHGSSHDFPKADQ